MLTTISTMRTIYYIYGGLCLIYIIYKTIDPRNKKPLSSAIGRFFKAVLVVAFISFLIGLITPYIGLYSIQSIFFK